MDASDSTPKRRSAKRELARLRLKKQLARERIELARLEKQAKLEELRACHAWPRQRNPGSDILREALTHRAETQARAILEAQRTRKDIPEGNFLWDWVSGYQDLIDRLRSPDGLLLTAISIAADRLYGSYWPFFRTWNDLALLRGASRICYQTGCLARGAINGVASYIVGDGFKYRVIEKDKGIAPNGLSKACQQILDDDAKLNSWPAIEYSCVLRDSRDGEWYLRDFPQDNGETLWRWIEPEQLIQPGDSTLKEWSFGKQNPIAPYDVETTLAYSACYDGNNSTYEVVESPHVIGHTHNVDSTVKRGIPDLAYDTYDFLKVASRLVGNMLEGAAVQASFAYVRQWESPVTGDTAGDFVSADADYTETNPWTGSTENVRRHKGGGIEDIPKGMEFKDGPSSPGGPNWVAIEQAALSAVAINWNAPKWLLSNDTDLNYASSLTAESPFVRRGSHMQNVQYKPRFTQAKWRVLRNYCAAKGGVRVNGRAYTYEQCRQFLDIQCEPPSMEVRNKADEAQANSVRVQGGWKSRQTVAQEEGLDWEQERANIEQYNDEMGMMNPLPMPSDDEEGGGGNPSPFEQILRESFTGTVTDKKGRKVHYVNGKRVKTSGKPSSGKQGGGGTPAAAAHQALTAKVEEKLSSDIKQLGTTPEGKAQLAKAHGIGQEIKDKLAKGVKAAIEAADTELGGGLSLFAAGHKAEGTARALSSVFTCVHEEIFEMALAQHSLPGAHAVGMVAAKVAAAAESAILKGIAWSWAKVRGVGEGRTMESRESGQPTDADKQLIAALAKVAGEAVRQALAAAGVEDAEIDHAAAEKRIAELMGAKA